MKKCKKCNTILHVDSYRYHATNKDNLRGTCKKCEKYNRQCREELNKNPCMIGTKRCRKCLYTLNKTDFIKNKTCKDGLNGWCKDCSKNENLKKKYNLTLEEYRSMLKRQQYKCAICEIDKPAGRQNVFVVDHCHDTGKVRGLLCNHCNTGIGKLNDDIKLLKKAIEYLL